MDCPICKKSGLPDYTLSAITCPQCNSDLKGFLVINKIMQESLKLNRRNKWYYVFIIITTVLILCVFSLFRSNYISRQERLTISDSINYYKEQIKTYTTGKTDTIIHPIRFTYLIKRGDNLSKIAHYFYNDWTQYKKIEQDNHLESNHILMPNDTLYLYLKAE